MNADYFRTLYQYNYDIQQQLWDSALTLTDAQFTQEWAYSIGSLRNHFVHVTRVDQRWFERIKGGPVSARLEYADFPTAASIYTLWQPIKDDILATVGALDDAALNRVVEYDLPQRGGVHRNTVGEILAHVVNHNTDHRAQMLRLLHDLGAPTFEQDFIIWQWEH